MRIERRGRQPHQAFAMVPNETARDKDLTFRSRGILAMLLSHDDGFDITADRVAKEGVEGRDAVRKSFKELEAAGYIRRPKVRDAATGRLTTKVYLYPYGDAPTLDPDIAVDDSEEEPESPGTDFQSSVDQSPVDQASKEDHQENQDAAAVPEEGAQAQAPADETPAAEAAATGPEPERDDYLVVPCDNDDPHPPHRWWTEAIGGYQYQRQCEGVTVEEIEQAARDIAAAAHATDIGLDEPAPGYPDGVGAAYPDQPAETMDEGVAIITETLGGQVVSDSHGGNTHDPDGPRAQHHGGNRYTVADDPRPCPPFPAVVQRNLANWWGVDAREGALWEAAWQTADMATSRAVAGDAIYYDVETHLMAYLMRARQEGRRPRHDLWVRFFIEDRAKHIQTLRANEQRLARQDEDPAEREMRSATTLPPDWGNSMEG